MWTRYKQNKPLITNYIKSLLSGTDEIRTHDLLHAIDSRLPARCRNSLLQRYIQNGRFASDLPQTAPFRVDYSLQFWWHFTIHCQSIAMVLAHRSVITLPL